MSLWKGSLVHDIHAIHRRYGSIVRVAPNEISVARSDGWNDIYCRRAGHQPFPKNPIWWGDLPGRTPSILSTPSLPDHRRMRALLRTCFTPSALQAQEPAIMSHIDHMVDQLRKRCVNGKENSTTVNIVEWVPFVLFDIIEDLGFGETFRCLDNIALHPWVAELYSYSKVGALVAALRHYTIIFNIFMRCLPAKSLEASRANYNWGVAKTRQRLDLETQREDFVSRILQFSDNDDLRMSVPELENNMNFLVVAGSDTCATVLSGTLNYLVKTPKALKALVHEIRSSHRNPSEMTFENLQKLEYLIAVVEEGLRLCPPHPSGLQHIVPAGGDTVCGGWLPGGTHVSVHQQSLYRSPNNFHEPDAFCPERWLSTAKNDTASPFHGDNREDVQSFGTGSWSCIGQILGYAELHTILAKLLWHFDIGMAPGGRDVEWIMQRSYALMQKEAFDVQLTHVGGK